MASIQKAVKGYRAQIRMQSVRDSRLFPTRRKAILWAVQREADIPPASTSLPVSGIPYARHCVVMPTRCRH